MTQNYPRTIAAISILLVFASCGAREQSTVTQEASNEIIGVVWQWVHSLYNNDTEAVPVEPSKYTLEFKNDGTVNIRADCNYGGGTYTTEGSSINIEIDRMTRAACPEGSLDEQFLKDLSAAAIFFLRDGELYVDLKYDTGTMRFRKAEE
jgi:heat shock protein HslJ